MSSGERRGGFTLLEVMVAMAVIAVAFTAMLGLHVRNLRLAAREQAYTQSLLLARSLIAEAELAGFPATGESSGDFEGRFPGQYTGFVWQQTVSDTPIPQTRELTVRVAPESDPQAAAELTLFLRGDAA